MMLKGIILRIESYGGGTFGQLGRKNDLVGPSL